MVWDKILSEKRTGSEDSRDSPKPLFKKAQMEAGDGIGRSANQCFHEWGDGWTKELRKPVNLYCYGNPNAVRQK
jgi:hypothetical protein